MQIQVDSDFLTVSLGQEYENEEIEENLTEAPIKRYLRARPLRWGKRGVSSTLNWGKRWGSPYNGARYGERMSFEESDIFFAILAYMAHIKAKFVQNPPTSYFKYRSMFPPHLIGKK